MKSRQTRFSPVAGPSRPAKARFHPEAQAEYLEVIAYLGLHAPRAVEAFAADVQEAVDFIQKHPEGAPVEQALQKEFGGQRAFEEMPEGAAVQ